MPSNGINGNDNRITEQTSPPPVQRTSYSCRYCGGDLNLDNAVEYTGYYFHEGCMSNCHTCNEESDKGSMFYYDTHYYHNSDECFWGNHVQCSNCSIIYLKGFDMAECPCRRDIIINEYSYKPKPKFLKMENELEPCLYMGLELEVENYDCAFTNKQYVHKYLKPVKDIYVKHDGSLNSGFEIVTHPMTLDYHKKFNWKNFLDHLDIKGFKSDVESCGLHVHVNKSILNELEKTRLAIFINTQYQMCEKVARRSNEHYAKFKKMNRGMFKTYYNNENKYEALNWYPEQTVEFRMFKGTLDPECLYASLELVHSSIMFTKSVHSTLKLVKPEKAWERFCKYLKVHEETYQYLPKYLAKNNLLKIEV